MTPRLMLIALPLLAACTDNLIKDSDVLKHAANPLYVYSESGHVIPSSCQNTSSGYSSRAPRCESDLILARQVSNPRDLVDPQRPGPAAAGPVGRAAESYLYKNSELSTLPYPVSQGRAPSTPERARSISVGAGQQPGAAPYDPYAGTAN